MNGIKQFMMIIIQNIINKNFYNLIKFMIEI